MVRLCISLLFSLPLFSISIENEEKLQTHQSQSYHEDFLATGLVYSHSGGTSYGIGTGTFIHPSIILTAAHVVHGAKNISFYALCEHEDHKLLYKEYKGLAVCHPKYVPSNTKYIKKESEPYDIALIFLDQENLEVKIPYLSINHQGENTRYYTCGYGTWKNNTPTEDITHRRLSARVNRPTYSEEQSHCYIDFENSRELEYFGSSRPGDSGGSIFTFNDNISAIHCIVQSIVAENEESEPYYGKYTSIGFNLQWILQSLDVYSENKDLFDIAFSEKNQQSVKSLGIYHGLNSN